MAYNAFEFNNTGYFKPNKRDDIIEESLQNMQDDEEETENSENSQSPSTSFIDTIKSAISKVDKHTLICIVLGIIVLLILVSFKPDLVSKPKNSPFENSKLDWKAVALIVLGSVLVTYFVPFLFFLLKKKKKNNKSNTQ